MQILGEFSSSIKRFVIVIESDLLTKNSCPAYLQLES